MFWKLRELRIKKRYTTRDMSEMLNISKPFYCQIENQKRRLSYDMAVKIASIFNVRPDTIFYKDFISQMDECEQEQDI